MDPPTLPLSAAQHAAAGDDGSVPGLVVVFAAGAADVRLLPLDGPLELGRGADSATKLDDGRVSRRHARVELVGGRCLVTDLGSQNGTYVDGDRVLPRAQTAVGRAIRVGDTLLVPCGDIRPLERAGVRSVDGFVRGPAMQAVIAEAERAGRAGTALHVRGESGSGKEGVVHAFHRAGSRAGRVLIAVNCAAIPETIAERLLFGARRGAFSGADADAAGYLQEADGSTLFLDEIGELDLQVQAKLLRALESREIMPVGASKPRKVDFALCSATNKDLRAAVAAGAMREDLYFRIAMPAVTLPPLRDRPEEIPALIERALSALSPAQAAHVSLVEHCLLRPWPGNVRELLAEVRAAAQAAGDGNRVTAAHLSPTAGSVFGSGAAGPSGRTASGSSPDGSGGSGGADSDTTADEPRKRISRDDAEWKRRIEDALRASGGNIAAAARSLGLHRTQLRRLIERHGVSPMTGAAGGVSDDTDDGAE